MVDQDARGTNYAGVDSKTAGLNDGQWHGVHFSRQSAVLRLFIDGVLEDENTGAGVADIKNGNDFRIGRSLVHNVSRFAADATFDDARIYDMAISQPIHR